MSRWRVRVDPTKCTGRGLCAELLPEAITLDDWGYPIFDDDGVIGHRLLRHAKRTVAACPMLALDLEPVPSTSVLHKPITLRRSPVQ